MNGLWLYLICIFLNCGNLFLQVFFAVMYVDLESDYINPIELCSRVNQWLPIDMGLNAFITFLLLIHFEWFSVLLNIPILAYNGMQFANQSYKLDPTEIFRTLHKHKKRAYIKLGVFLLFFFYYLYSMITSIVLDYD